MYVSMIDIEYAVARGFRLLWEFGLLETIQRGVPIKVLVLNNEKAETTGGQKIPKRCKSAFFEAIKSM